MSLLRPGVNKQQKTKKQTFFISGVIDALCLLFALRHHLRSCCFCEVVIFFLLIFWVSLYRKFLANGFDLARQIQIFYLPPIFEKRREVLFWVPSPYLSPPSPWMFCLISRLLLKLAFWNLACAIYGWFSQGATVLALKQQNLELV